MTDLREATMFKPVPGGYVFRAPNPWVFGRHRFYLVDEKQKTQLLAIVTAHSQVFFWLAFVDLFAAASLVFACTSHHGGPTWRDALVMFALVPVCLYGAMVTSMRAMTRQLAPILAGLPRTEQQITTAEAHAAARKAMCW